MRYKNYSLIKDSNLLSTLFFNFEEKEIIDDEIIQLTPLIDDHKLLFDFYSNNSINDIELLKLIEYFRYIDSNRIKEVMISLKFKNSEYFGSRINKNLIEEYNSIIIKETFMLTSIFNNCYNSFKISLNNLSKLNNSEELDLPLLFAIKFDNYQIVNDLINFGADINCRSGYPLIFASLFNHTKIFKLLLDNGANINMNCDYGLLYSITNPKNQGITCTKFILCHGLTIFGENETNYVQFFNNKNIKPTKYSEIFQLEIKTNHYKNINENLCFIIACINGNCEIIKKLISLGVDVTFNDNAGLKLSSTFGNYESTEFLLNHISNIIDTDELNFNLEKCLKYACKRYHIKLVEFLLTKIYPTNESLCVACKNGYYNIVKLFLKNNTLITSNPEPLICACEANYYLIARLLINNGSYVHSKCLYEACKNGNVKIYKLLIENGVDIHFEKDSSLLIAVENGHEEIVKLLIKSGLSQMNYSAVNVAFFNFDLRVIDLLLKNCTKSNFGILCYKLLYCFIFYIVFSINKIKNNLFN